MNLEEIRGKIDLIDSEIIRLLSERGKLVSEAGKLKKDDHSVRDPKRVEDVIKNVKAVAHKVGLDTDIAENIYRTITGCFISQEMKEFSRSPVHYEKPIQIFRKNALQLKPNVPGAKMWAVALDRAMLTYFELEANTVFREHLHEAEQITMILEGELTFTYDDSQVTLYSGDVISIPSNAVHSALTKEKPCKAVDAWSPVRSDYLE